MFKLYSDMDDIHYDYPTWYRMPFYLSDSTGNNAFSYDDRKCRRIRVASLIQGQVILAREGREYAFVEVDEQGLEQAKAGLENFIQEGKIFFFDNHNHCYYFYKQFLRRNNLSSLSFIHVDQHKDMRKPQIDRSAFAQKPDLIERGLKRLGLNLSDSHSLWNPNGECHFFEEETIDFLYTNLVLNVGDFIVPLLQEGRISELAIVDSSYSMKSLDKTKLSGGYVLDLDLDFFSSDMDYIPWDEKICFVKSLVKDARAIFIASSPYFITFERAMDALRQIFDENTDLKE